MRINNLDYKEHTKVLATSPLPSKNEYSHSENLPLYQDTEDAKRQQLRCRKRPKKRQKIVSGENFHIIEDWFQYVHQRNFNLPFIKY